MKQGVLIVTIQEVNKFKIVNDIIYKQITQKQASECLNLSTRQIRRLVKRVKKEGLKGVIHKSRGKPSRKRLSEAIKLRIIQLAKTKYIDFKPTFLAEKLSENENIKVSSESVRKILIEADLWKTKKRKTKHRSWRERRDCIGELVQLDGSHHDWFEGRAPKCVLIGFIDDASNRVFLKFTEGETTEALMRITQEYIKIYGCPVALYVDKDTIYKVARGEGMTQFARAMQELGIKIIYAHSPQAKGRIERSFKTHQDRLVKELRLNNISSIKEANKFLERKYIKEHNEKFMVKPKNDYDMHRKLPSKINLSKTFSKHSKRSIANDYTLKYKGRVFQILDTPNSRDIILNNKAIVEENLEGSIRIKYKDKYLKYKEISEKHTASYSRWIWVPSKTG
ncbi:MAG: ISNCY family transposase [Candidatus Diapherotrites archaeon]